VAGNQDHLAAFAADSQYPVTAFLAKVTDVRAGGFEDPQAEEAQHGHQGEVVRISRLAGGGEQGARWVNPGVGDSVGTDGRRTCSAGECPSTPSTTQVRENPAATGNRRDTVEGLNRRISCIHRMYSSRCGRRAASGSRSRPAHQVR
jgi:hypothetical protein